jgi:hypothetical protein
LSDGDTLALTAEEREALIGLLRRAIDEARYPFSHRYDPIKAILAKLDPPAPKSEPLPPLRSGMGPTHGQVGGDGEGRRALHRQRGLQ